MRKALGSDYKPATQGKLKISGWKSELLIKISLYRNDQLLFPDVYRSIQDDGTLTPGDLRSVNEGLGQTHRAKLMVDDTVRTYSGEPRHHNGRPRSKVAKTTIEPARVTKRRVIKGNILPITTPKRHPSPARDIDRNPSPAKDRRRDLSLVRTTVRTPPLADPQAWLASIHGVRKAAPKAVEQLATGPIPEAVKQPAADVATKAIVQPRIDTASKAVQKPTFRPALEPSQKPASENGSVSVAFLMSLGVKFTQEQLRALTAEAQIGNDATETSVTFDKKAEEQGQESVNIAKSSVANNEERTKTSEARDQILTNAVETSVANDEHGLYPSAAEDHTVPNATKRYAATAEAERLAIATSQSDMLRRQREMIIGTQVYKNRYSHAAGSLVDSFQRMTLTDFNPAPPPTAHAQAVTHNNALSPPPARAAPKSIAGVRTLTMPTPPAAAPTPTVTAKVAATAPAPAMSDRRPAAAALRPRFIPNAPVPSDTVTPPAALASRTVNPPLAVNNPFGPARRSRPAGPSLPPHLMGKVASSDPGAAARAQYGAY